VDANERYVAGVMAVDASVKDPASRFAGPGGE
jgi:hypothetical protein